MKITVAETKTHEWNFFPCYGVEKHGFIVLFSESGKGMVVADPNDSYCIGYYSEDWNMRGFTPFKGKITIEQ